MEKLKIYAAEQSKVDDETRKLTALFKEALALPAVDEAIEPIGCPLCGADAALTPERVVFIRQRVADTESYRTAEANAKMILAEWEGSLDPLENNIAGSLPRFIVYPSSARRKRSFRVERIRALLGEDASRLGEPWLAALRQLVRAWHVLMAHVRSLKGHVASYAADLRILPDWAELERRFDACAQAFLAYEAALTAYLGPEKVLADRLTAIVDVESKTTGWQDLIDLARNPAALREALVDRAAREAALKELAVALKQVDKANAKVLDEKFNDLSVDVLKWWDLLRPDELSFFSAVKQRPGSRRT